MSLTNKGAARILNGFFRATSVPTTFRAVLVTSAVAPGVDTNLMSELTEIAAGNGYTSGGLTLNRNTTDFDVLTEDDTNDWALLEIKDLQWTASGGPIPASGAGARYLVVLDDNGTLGSAEVIAAVDLGSDRSVSSGQPLLIQDAKIKLAYNSGITNRGAKRILDGFFRNQDVPTNFYAALCTNATNPGGADINTLSDVTEIATGSGYSTGGISLNRDVTDFDSLVENDTDDRAELQIKDIVYSASGGALPSSGTARYMALTDDNGTVGSRDIIAGFDLGSDQQVSDGNDLTVQDAEIRIIQT